MNEATAEKIRNKFGYYTERQPHDEHWVRIKPSITVEECEALFKEMTAEVFEKHADLLNGISLMVHLAFPPDKVALFPAPNVNKENALEPNPESPAYGVKLEQDTKIYLESGVLDRCHIRYPNFNSTYDFWYFTHKDSEKYQQYIVDKFGKDGIKLYHEWYFVYLSPNAYMGRHLDYLHGAMRYSFSVRQPKTDRSITIGDTNHYIPTGTAYIMDGSISHEVVQNTNSNRLMLLGAVMI